jgi:hypothetical protein
MQRAKELAEYLSVALAAAGVDARIEPGIRDGKEVVDIHEDGGGLTTVTRGTVSVPKRTIGGHTHATVELWTGTMDMGPQTWHPEEPPADAEKNLGTWEGVGRAALELTCAIVRQRVADKLTDHGLARAWEDDQKLEV